MISRRDFLKLGGAVGAGVLVVRRMSPDLALAQEPPSTSSRRPFYHHRSGIMAPPGGSLDPTTIPKYAAPLVIPPAMPMTSSFFEHGKLVDYYEIAMRQFQQQILPSSLPVTTVWGYGAISNPATFHHPGFTIEAKVNRPVRVKWINGLVDENNHYLPHLLPVDQTLHWANPPGGIGGRDMHGTDPTPYTGPVPIISHVHGAHVTEESDGFAEAWFLPDASDIPDGYARVGSYYEQFKAEFEQKHGVTWGPGTVVSQYPCDQRASTIWYHDHAMGMTRLNVRAASAGFFLLRGGQSDLAKPLLPGPAPMRGDRSGKRYYEIPLAIQDPSFNTDGSMFYPDNRAFFEGLNVCGTPPDECIPYIPQDACGGPSDVSPIYNPEFFGNTIMVNGNTWPVLNVEQRRYRFRLLNGCSARTLLLKLVSDPLAPRPVTPMLPFWLIGIEGGFVNAPLELSEVFLTLAERKDVIVDFTDIPIGTEIYMINEGFDEPYNGSNAPDAIADPATTGQVMKFVVTRRHGLDVSLPPERLQLPHFKNVGPASNTRQISLNEMDSLTVPVLVAPDGSISYACGDPNAVAFGPTMTKLGTVNPDGTPNLLNFDDPITENPALNATEIWEFWNYTVDAHPMHIHQVMFQVVNRQPMGGGDPVPPYPYEAGFKDTVISLPGYITRVIAKWDLPGLYVYHCHIIDHEDNEMMRPFFVGTLPR